MTELPFVSEIAARLNLRAMQAEAVLALLAEGATIPFIARYRKDRTGNLDEVAIEQIRDLSRSLQELADRRDVILRTIEEQGKLTPELKHQIDSAASMSELEDLYLPYRPKRRTRAQVAREKGLQPLADLLLAQDGTDAEQAALAFVGDAVASADEALQGARDIIAEQVSEAPRVRARMRQLFEREGMLISQVLAGKETEAAKYRDYFDYREAMSKVPGHRALAVLRGFMEGFLRVSIEPNEEAALPLMEQDYLRSNGPAAAHLRKAIRDAWKRLLQPSLESEFRQWLKQKSDEEAIEVFAANLRQLLLASPLGSKRVLAIDPGYRTGCKMVALDASGALLAHTVIYVHEPGRLAESERVVRQWVDRYAIEAFAVGDGTAGRETEQFIKGLGLPQPLFMVNEAGASVYSASEVAREEFPNEDVTVRGSVSIGRRLMDPLAELVKIDPKSIGVGQYQHDVNQVRLREKLDETVASCVNRVGVNLHTASPHLLKYVSGISESLARNIVAYREQAGGFRSRRQLREVPRLGDKAFEQCAGFLRIPNAEHPLDASGVHPESYPVVEQMAADLGVSLKELLGNEALIRQINPAKYAAFGEHTVKDILAELRKPGLDPRKPAEAFSFGNVYKPEDLIVGQVLPGLVTNLTRFGAFVNIGVKQDGLVHVSEIAWRYVADPAEVLKLGQAVMVKVLEVDLMRQRIALSIRQASEKPAGERRGVKPAPSGGPGKRQRDSADMGEALAQLKKRFGR